jgi:hypothetical protein
MLGQDNYEIKTVSLTTNPVHSIGGFQVATDEKIMEWYKFHKLGFYNAPMPEM